MMIHIQGGYDAPVYRHNDYLGLAEWGGIIPAIIIIWFLIKTLNQVKHNFTGVLLLVVMVIPFFQMTIFSGYKAALIITVIGLAAAQGVKNGTDTEIRKIRM